MTDVLLQELSNGDIEWLKQIGKTQKVPMNTLLIEQSKQVDFVYIIIQGEFVATLARNENGRLGQVFALLEDDPNLEQEIGKFSEGEILGEMNFLEINPAANSIKALRDSVVLTIPREPLNDKLKQDYGFASRFYRGMTILLLERFQNLISLYLKKRLGQIAPLQEVSLIFGELRDSDVDWFLQKGKLETIPPDTNLIQSGEQVENIYILLQGVMSVSVSEQKKNRLNSIFSLLESDTEQSSTPIEREIGQISRGEIVGEIAVLDSHRSYSTIKTLETCSVLAISRQQIILKLQQDVGMASRFYRVIAKLMSGRVQGMISRLGFGKTSYTQGENLSQDSSYEDEIDLDVMDNLTLGGARFDWMLRRLKVS